MPYAVTFKASALKQLEKLSRPLARRLFTRASALGDHPRAPGHVKLAGAANLYRVRVGDYRIVYAIDDNAKVIDVRIVAHRRDVYRGL